MVYTCVSKPASAHCLSVKILRGCSSTTCQSVERFGRPIQKRRRCRVPRKPGTELSVGWTLNVYLLSSETSAYLESRRTAPDARGRHLFLLSANASCYTNSCYIDSCYTNSYTLHRSNFSYLETLIYNLRRQTVRLLQIMRRQKRLSRPTKNWTTRYFGPVGPVVVRRQRQRRRRPMMAERLTAAPLEVASVTIKLAASLSITQHATY